tara:strand:- start:365 stop:487 length:123 start_codon:yes stop_codon:yes gene_type:complete
MKNKDKKAFNKMFNSFNLFLNNTEEKSKAEIVKKQINKLK